MFGYHSSCCKRVFHQTRFTLTHVNIHIYTYTQDGWALGPQRVPSRERVARRESARERMLAQTSCASSPCGQTLFGLRFLVLGVCSQRPPRPCFSLKVEWCVALEQSSEACHGESLGGSLIGSSASLIR